MVPKIVPLNAITSSFINQVESPYKKTPFGSRHGLRGQSPYESWFQVLLRTLISFPQDQLLTYRCVLYDTYVLVEWCAQRSSRVMV